MPTATPFIRYVTKPFITKLVAAIALLITVSYSYFFIDGWLYSDGCVQGNCDNGFGTFTYKKTAYQAALFSDGEKYAGEFKDEDFDGQGTDASADGSVLSDLWGDGH